MIIVLLFSTCLYFVRENNINFKDWITKILSCKIENSYWYLYAYLGMLLMLPYLRKIADKFNDADFKYIIFLHFLISSVVPIANYLVNTNFGFKINLYLSIPIATEKTIFFALVGFYLENVLQIDKVKKKQTLVLIIVSIIGILISSAFTYHQGINSKFTQDFVQLFDYVIAISVFVLIKYICVNKKMLHFQRAICTVGQLTFGMYLLDPFMKALLYNKIETILEVIFPTLIVSGIWCIFSMVISGLITLGLKKLPYIKKII